MLLSAQQRVLNSTNECHCVAVIFEAPKSNLVQPNNFGRPKCTVFWKVLRILKEIEEGASKSVQSMITRTGFCTKSCFACALLFDELLPIASFCLVGEFVATIASLAGACFG